MCPRYSEEFMKRNMRMTSEVGQSREEETAEEWKTKDVERRSKTKMFLGVSAPTSLPDN